MNNDVVHELMGAFIWSMIEEIAYLLRPKSSFCSMREKLEIVARHFESIGKPQAAMYLNMAFSECSDADEQSYMSFEERLKQ